MAIYVNGTKVSGGAGTPGRGISRAQINDNGELVLIYTDGTNDVVGKVVPQKGIDYYTSEDKTEIINAVLAQLSAMIETNS